MGTKLMKMIAAAMKLMIQVMRNMTAMRKPMLMTDEADVDDSDGDEDANKANHDHKEPQSS